MSWSVIHRLWAWSL